MQPINFCYWLQGWIELQNPNEITPVQLQEIKNHLSLVLEKKTPNLSVLEGVAQPLRLGTEPIYPITYCRGVEMKPFEAPTPDCVNLTFSC